MKKQILVIALSIITLAVNATIWRVSQDDSYLPHFKTVQAAVDGANAGDTIYVYPGTYGENVLVGKKLALFGAGYWLTESRTDSLSRFLIGTSLYNITFGMGSSESSITGFYFYSNSSTFICETTSNILISNINTRVRMQINNSTNIIIKKSYLEGISRYWNGNDWYDYGIVVSNSKNILIENSLLFRDCIFDDKSEVYLKNNYFNGNFSIWNATLENNIFMGSNYNFTYCWIENNIFQTGCTLNNPPLINCMYATLAQVYPNTILTDHYQLPANSVAKAKGLNGVDCGPFGGDDPYQISGVSTIPSIVDFNVKAHATEATGLKMRIKIKANK